MSDQYMLDALLGSSDRSELDNALASAYSPSMEISPHANPLSSYNFSSTNDPAGSSSDGAGHSRDFSSSSSSSLTRTPATTPTGRKRPRHNINLAPDQPPTARGNPRVRVFVACFQCRARKTRCDGAKPICCNCQKRPSEAEQCSYDSGTKRRGRVRGTVRARASTQSLTGNKTSKRKERLEDDREHVQSVHFTSSDASETPPVAFPLDEFSFASASVAFDPADEMAWQFDFSCQQGGSSTADIQSQGTRVVGTPPRDDGDKEQEEILPSRPGTQFARDTWWDALLTFYATEQGTGSDGIQTVSLSPAQRTGAMKGIVSDLKAFMQASPNMVNFMHLPRFFDMVFNPIRRSSLQPSVLLSVLALGVFSQSSEAERGSRGRAQALKLLDMAHGALEGALSTGWVDVGLAQAALLIVCFELQTHPLQSLRRARSALLLFDSLARLFSLPSVDDGVKPRGRVSCQLFRAATAYNNLFFNPAVHMGFDSGPQLVGAEAGSAFPSNLASMTSALSAPLLTDVMFNHQPTSTRNSPGTHASPQRGCNCLKLALGTTWPAAHRLAPGWHVSMMWPEGLSDGEFKREECRRLVWACVAIVAQLNAHSVASLERPETLGHMMFVREPEAFALMLPGEALATMGVTVEADDIWTLVSRTMLLMHICMRIRENVVLSEADRAQLAVHAWLEIDDIESRLDRHTCELDSAFGFQARKLLFEMRMLTSYEFQKFIPQVTTNGSTLFYRDKAENWLRYMQGISDWVWERVTNTAQWQGCRTSMLIHYFIASIQRALYLWKGDADLVSALSLSRVLAERVEYLMMFWPNIRLRETWTKLRMELVGACLTARIPPPSPALPHPARFPPQAPTM